MNMNNFYETERAIFYCWMQDNSLIDTPPMLREDDFKITGFRCMFNAAQSLKRKGIVVDMLTLAEECEQRDECFPPDNQPSWSICTAMAGIYYSTSVYSENDERKGERRNRNVVRHIDTIIQQLSQNMETS